MPEALLYRLWTARGVKCMVESDKCVRWPVEELWLLLLRAGAWGEKKIERKIYRQKIECPPSIFFRLRRRADYFSLTHDVISKPLSVPRRGAQERQ